MKKLVAMALSLTLAVSMLTACGGTSKIFGKKLNDK